MSVADSSPLGGTAASDAAPELRFGVDSVDAEVTAAVPTLAFRVRIDSPSGQPIRSLALNVQLRITAERRRYRDADSDRLHELFGRREQWPRSLGGLPWAHVAFNVPAFTGSTLVRLPVACTYDFDVVATKYLAALTDGEVPVELLFSGSTFYTADDGRLQIAQIPWDREASFRLPLRTWRQAVDSAFPDTAWLRVNRDTFDRLHACRSRRGLTTWEDTLEALLDGEDG